jgi:hypothetical protein
MSPRKSRVALALLKRFCNLLADRLNLNQQTSYSSIMMEKKTKSILKIPTKEWHDKSEHSQRPPSRPPKRRGSGHQAEAECTV